METKSIFKVNCGKPLQQKEIWLKNEDVAQQIKIYNKESQMLIKSAFFNGLLMAKEIKKVHDVIRVKLKAQRHNGIKSILQSHLYELMPENKEQMEKFPKMHITLDAKLVVPVYAAIRTRNKP